jgi:Fe-S-cluster containining protein
MTPPLAPDEGGPFEPLQGREFRFACHPGVPCFNECCADLRLVLTPYDIMRLKNRLGLSSGDFLDRYTESSTEPESRFPQVRLKMTDGPGRPCPFVTSRGCSVYEDRPGACRIYPVGRGSARGGREMFFLVREKHCRGFEQDRSWDVEAWTSDQGLVDYHRSNDRWMEIITSRDPLGPAEHLAARPGCFSWSPTTWTASATLSLGRVFWINSNWNRAGRSAEGR